MEPNYQFEAEKGDLYTSKNYEFRKMADQLYKKHGVINKKEYDVVLWMGCNLPQSSTLRDGLFKHLKGIQKLENSKKRDNLQNKLEL